MNNTIINGIRVFSFSSRNDLINYVEKEKKSLIAINAEKILHATDQTLSLINQNIGYSDGIGAVWALKKKGFKNSIKIPGCELWLDIVKALSDKKTFYADPYAYQCGPATAIVNRSNSLSLKYLRLSL